MKKENRFCSHIGWGALIALFGIFFLISNLLPDCGVITFWPIFLIAGGIYKAYCGCMCKNCQ